jgi:hypothetical protein
VAKVLCEATVMGYRSGSDSKYRFELEDDPMNLPADDVVDALIDHLRRAGYLTKDCTYETNSAMRNKDCGVVLGMGTLFIKGDPMPFAAFIAKAP